MPDQNDFERICAAYWDTRPGAGVRFPRWFDIDEKYSPNLMADHREGMAAALREMRAIPDDAFPHTSPQAFRDCLDELLSQAEGNK